jgi:hypothetical protein
MASQRQIEANRRNARKGGPKTEVGKQRSRLNSLKHGLTSSSLVVLPEEHRHEYDEVLQGFRLSFQPEGAAEEALVLRLAQAHWRSLRSRRVETYMLHLAAELQRHEAKELKNCPEHLNLHNAIGVAFLRMPPEQWQTYMRYDAAISRDFFRTLDALMRLQKARQHKIHQPEPEPQQALTRTAGAATQLSDSGTGSVSQAHRNAPPPVPSAVFKDCNYPPESPGSHGISGSTSENAAAHFPEVT